jgi:hypothetical protein
LAQNLTLDYSQNVLRFHEIGARTHFVVAGRTSGQMNAERVLGPRPVSVEFYRKFGDVRLVASNTCGLRTNAGGANRTIGGQDPPSETAYRLGHVLINDMAISVSTEEAVLVEQLQSTFGSLIPAKST